LNLNEIRWLDDFAELAEVDTFRVGAVGHGISRLVKNQTARELPAIRTRREKQTKERL
jgi:hypothetical protein